ncbi:MAG: hypothetical protein CSA54_02580 [Gammaproteobacteria bacterium]|nr:MAG: hypothetical protein CSA54_02580 [Gammaproteobacteria bacterium]
MAKQSRSIANAGLVDGALQACPNRPSCVCSTDPRKPHAIAALTIPEGTEDAIAALAEIIRTMPNTRILKQEANYLHATFTSRVFRFIDDVELLLDGDQVQVRSVSRVGHSDLGANRKRVEAIRARFQ